MVWVNVVSINPSTGPLVVGRFLQGAFLGGQSTLMRN